MGYTAEILEGTTLEKGKVVFIVKYDDGEESWNETYNIKQQGDWVLIRDNTISSEIKRLDNLKITYGSIKDTEGQIIME
jgi:hypothetical protein